MSGARLAVVGGFDGEDPPSRPIDDEIAAIAHELVDSVSFDVNGMSLPNTFAGGHGGLTSDKTIRLADRLRKLLLKRAGT